MAGERIRAFFGGGDLYRLFGEGDRERIGDAITLAESRTSGEIVVVVASESDSYLYAPVLWAALTALVIPWPLIFLTWATVQSIFALQLVVFAGLVAFLSMPAFKHAIVPGAIKRQRVHRRAVEQFLAQSMHATKSRTGVLIFVSLGERHAVVLADTGIDDKVAAGTWETMVGALTSRLSQGEAVDGLVEAITQAGELLARHFPPCPADPNELPNHLILLD